MFPVLSYGRELIDKGCKIVVEVSTSQYSTFLMAKLMFKVGEVGEEIRPDKISQTRVKEEEASQLGGGAEPISAEDLLTPPSQPANHAPRSPAHCLLRHVHVNRVAEAVTPRTSSCFLHIPAVKRSECPLTAMNPRIHLIQKSRSSLLTATSGLPC
ncbi:hypothetical protein E2C01_093539 [Portunus trituberculatus]|uniref:Uncharacterized protein n=1 Tax=Portunus trituberculatus TaxID=210409 RepID=A0A5B7JUG7_PORTR|nr:hypothetical protein [Portunus trituberculatus]